MRNDKKNRIRENKDMNWKDEKHKHKKIDFTIPLQKGDWEANWGKIKVLCSPAFHPWIKHKLLYTLFIHYHNRIHYWNWGFTCQSFFTIKVRWIKSRGRIEGCKLDNNKGLECGKISIRLENNIKTIEPKGQNRSDLTR